uniref:Uncharacterized protein n=1 Tax=Pseudomonas phage HRDY3 TaxID=3236930 RepID=A0AB39CDY7_9VIRU
MKTEIAIASVPQYPVYAVGTEVWFHPAIRRLNLGNLYDHAIRAKVVATNVKAETITYDLALDVANIDQERDYYMGIPVAQVDAFFVCTKDDLLAQNNLLGTEVATASSVPEPSPAMIRKFAQRYQEIQADIPVLRKELGRN